MQTLQLTTHIENNAQVNLTLPPEYANQDVELVVIIQAKKQISDTIEKIHNKKNKPTEGEKVLDILKTTGYLASMPDVEDLSENYKDYLDWSDKV